MAKFEAGSEFSLQGSGDEAPALSWGVSESRGVSPSKAPPASTPGSGKESLGDMGEQEI